MVSDDDGGEPDVPDPVPTPPGMTLRPSGPLGVPMPVPDIEDNRASPSRDPSDDLPGESAIEGGLIETPSDDVLLEAVEYGENYIDRVEEAMGSEMCPLCREILQNLRDLPAEEQVQGVRELAQLKRRADEGASPGELADLMDTFEVVDDPGSM